MGGAVGGMLLGIVSFLKSLAKPPQKHVGRVAHAFAVSSQGAIDNARDPQKHATQRRQLEMSKISRMPCKTLENRRKKRWNLRDRDVSRLSSNSLCFSIIFAHGPIHGLTALHATRPTSSENFWKTFEVGPSDLAPSIALYSRKWHIALIASGAIKLSVNSP